MSNGFAGAKSVDDRRRRRLAQEGLDGESPRASRRKSSRSAAAAQSADPSQLENSLLRHSAAPVNTWLWRQPWKYVALLVAMVLFNLALVWHSHWPPVAAVTSEATTIQAAEAWLVNHLAIGYFAACAVVAWFILYHRSRSRLDFCGRYRLWIWLAVFWTATTACSMTGWHERWGQWLAGQTSLSKWNGPLWCWLVPAAAALFSTTYLLRNEFASCRTAWWIHRASLVIAVAAVVGMLIAGTSLDSHWLDPAATLATVLWPTAELGSLLFFARRVVHVSSEPTVIVQRQRTRKVSVIRRFKRFIAWILAPREERSAYGDGSPEKTTRKRRSRRATKARTSSRKRQTVKAVAADPTPAVTTSEAESARTQIEKSIASASQPRPVASPSITQQTAAKPVATPQLSAPQAKPQVESRPTTPVRVDAPQAKRGPHFAQASRQEEEREAVAAVRQERQQIEDDFGDVDDWDEEESDESQHRQRKHKKKRRR